jgi:hypothetical protein
MNVSLTGSSAIAIAGVLLERDLETSIRLGDCRETLAGVPPARSLELNPTATRETHRRYVDGLLAKANAMVAKVRGPDELTVLDLTYPPRFNERSGRKSRLDLELPVCCFEIDVDRTLAHFRPTTLQFRQDHLELCLQAQVPRKSVRPGGMPARRHAQVWGWNETQPWFDRVADELGVAETVTAVEVAASDEETDTDAVLGRVGLTAAALQLKLDGFNRALATLRRGFGRRRLRRVLEWANRILGSRASRRSDQGVQRSGRRPNG